VLLLLVINSYEAVPFFLCAPNFLFLFFLFPGMVVMGQTEEKKRRKERKKKAMERKKKRRGLGKG